MLSTISLNLDQLPYITHLCALSSSMVITTVFNMRQRLDADFAKCYTMAPPIGQHMDQPTRKAAMV